MIDVLATARESAVQTASYLLAYHYVLVLAPLIHLGLVALGPGRRGWLKGRRDWVAAIVLGLTEPLSRSAFERNLRRLDSPAAGVVYLGVSHSLTAYAWVLLGPLLGKDFLLSHVLGVALFVLLAVPLVRRARLSVQVGVVERSPTGTGQAVARGAIRCVWLGGLGLLLGGLVAAWGFSTWSWAPAGVGAGGWWTQLASGGVGIAVALVGVPPVANLFVGTYLWKIGLAHAGIVAFFCAATAAPTRWRLYSRTYGRRGAVRFVAVLLVAALLAGLGTAGIFGAFDLSIHYKLIPQQLWELSR